VLDGVAEAVEGADVRVAAPGEDELASAAHTYHLVVDEVRRHPDQGQVPPPLADDLVRAGRRDEVCEALQGYRIAVPHQFRYRLAQAYYISHSRAPSVSFPFFFPLG
jgi:hypothetical protein